VPAEQPPLPSQTPVLEYVASWLTLFVHELLPQTLPLG
jgi:hypothetical protein